MAVTFDENWVKAYCARTGTPLPKDFASGRGGEAEKPKKRSKYGNVKTTVNGMEIDSMHEARMYRDMLLRLKAGEFRALCCQVTFLLPGGVKYIADFVTLNLDGSYTVYDAKSEATRKDKVYRLKKRQMRECLGIEIQEI